MGGNESNKLVKGAFLLTLAGLISKVLSAGYRIPLQNLTGDFGFYIYQQIYPLLGMVLILSLYGFPSAVSKLTAELKGRNREPSFRGFYLPLFLIMLVINGVFFIILFFSAPMLADWIGDEQLTKAYQITAFTFLLIPFTSLLRGVSQGYYEMKPIAYSQIGEQLIRVSLIIIIAYLFVIEKIDVYKIGEYAALASILGAIMAIIILLLFFVRSASSKSRSKEDTYDVRTIPWKYYISTIVTLGIIASLNHMVLLIIQFADVFTLVPYLKEYGLPSLKAMEAKGVFDRGQPLIQLGTVLGSSFALALFPAISKQRLVQDEQLFYHYTSSALTFSFHLAAGATIGLITIFPEVNILLFQDAKGTSSLQILALAIFLSSITITGSSILQGLGYYKRTASFIIIAFLAKWLGNQLFVPLWGIKGSAIATILSLCILCVLILLELQKRLPKLRLLQKINWFAMIKASLCMVVYLKLVDYIIPYMMIASRVGLSLYIIFMAVTGACIYMFLLLKGRAFTEKELAMLPFSRLFIRLHKGRISRGI